MNNEENSISGFDQNRYIIILIALVLCTITFYVGFRYGINRGSVDLQNYTRVIETLQQSLADKDATISSLNNEIDELNEQLSGYNELSESYNVLQEEYNELYNDYSNSMGLYEEIIEEYNELKDLQLVDENSTRTLVGNMSFTLPQRYVVYASSLYGETATDDSGILTASTLDDDTIISFSWDTLEEEPGLYQILDNAYDSIGVILEYDMYKTAIVGERRLIYSSFKTVLDNKYTYIDVSTWYDESDGKHYVCIVQNTKNDVYNTLHEFVSGFNKIM